MKRNKLVSLALGGVVALGLAGGALFVRTASAAPAAAASTSSAASIVLVHRGGGSRSGLGVGEQSLADALGVTLEALTAARETARVAMIDQAVTDGLMTEAQAETLKAAGAGFTRLPGAFGYDKDAYLAEALGVPVEEVAAARLEAYETQLAAAVAAGTLTQEEADLLLAGRVADSYLDTDAINAQIAAAQEAAVAAALADGAITQAQADALRAQLELSPYQFRGDFGGPHGGRGGRGFGGSLDLLPDSTTPDTTDTAFDA